MGFFDGPKLQMSIPHGLAFDEVTRRFQEQLLQQLQSTFPEVQITNLRQKWDNDHGGAFSCKVGGYSVTGMMEFRSAQLDLVVQLPFGASTKINIESTQETLEASLTEMLS